MATMTNPAPQYTTDWAKNFQNLLKTLGGGSAMTESAAGNPTGSQIIGGPIDPNPSGTSTGGDGASGGDWSAKFAGLMSTIGPQANAPEVNPVDQANKIAAGTTAFRGATIPGYEGLAGQDTATLQAQLAGQVPQDVKNQLAQAAAERGVATGMPGAPANEAAYLQAVMKNSEQQQATGRTQMNKLVDQNQIDPAMLAMSAADRVKLSQDLTTKMASIASELSRADLDATTKLELEKMQEAANLVLENLKRTPINITPTGNGKVTIAGGGANYGYPI